MIAVVRSAIPADRAPVRPAARVRVVSSTPLICSALSAMRRTEGLPYLLADRLRPDAGRFAADAAGAAAGAVVEAASCLRSEEHTSELQSRGHLVCRLLLDKKKTHKAY